MEDLKAVDCISDLPESIIETILTFLPIRDAVRTCILSSKWRYRWTTLPDLVFDDRCLSMYNDGKLEQHSFIKFVTRVLLLHQGPINKFQLATSFWQCYPDIDQWVLFLSRGDIKELILELGEGKWYKVPASLFNCNKLMQLELIRCELDPPPAFKGFSWLKGLSLHQVSIAPEAIESLISSCPLLERLLLSYVDSLSLNVRAANLKFLYLEGEFRDICLEHTPLLVTVSVAMYMTDDNTEYFEQSSSCSFIKFLGGVPHLERLTGQIDFTKYLSIGDYQGIRPITFSYLKVIELYEVSFEDTKEMLVVLRLITNSPHLKELQISGSSNAAAITEAPNLDFWATIFPKDCTFRHLKVVKITDMSGVPHEMEFIKFLLASSPVLEMMSIALSLYVRDRRLSMLIELLQFRRASAQAAIFFMQD